MKRSRKNYNYGKWQVERERSRIEDFVKPNDDREPSSIGDEISGIMKKMGLGGEHWVGLIGEEWGAIVGDAVATHTRPGRVDNRRLIVFVDSSVWLNELTRYGKKEMLANLQKRFGKNRISSLTIQLDPDLGQTG